MVKTNITEHTLKLDVDSELKVKPEALLEVNEMQPHYCLYGLETIVSKIFNLDPNPERTKPIDIELDLYQMEKTSHQSRRDHKKKD